MLFLHCEHEVSENLILYRSKYLLPLRRRYLSFPSANSGLLDIFNGIGGDQTFLFGPGEPEQLDFAICLIVPKWSRPQPCPIPCPTLSKLERRRLGTSS